MLTAPVSFPILEIRPGQLPGDAAQADIVTDDEEPRQWRSKASR